MKNDTRIAKLEKQTDEAEHRKAMEIIDRLTHDQTIVFLWLLSDDLAGDKDLPPSDRPETVARRDRIAKAIAEKEAAEPGYFERVLNELKTLGVLCG